MKRTLQKHTPYKPFALSLPAKKFSYRFLLSACLFLLILSSLAFTYTGISTFILLFINVAFCADIFVRCAWKDLTRLHATFAVLVSLSVIGGLIYCALNTFLTRPLAGPSVNLYAYESFVLTLALWVQFRMTRSQEKTNVFIKKIDDFLPKSGRLVEGAKARKVFAGELKAGDVVLVEPGERVPCDGVIVQGSTALDEQLISGNLRPAAKTVGGHVYAGTLNKTKPVRVRVEIPLASSVVAGILEAIKNNEVRHNEVQYPLDKAAFYLIILVGTVAAAVCGYQLVHFPQGGWVHQSGILWLILAFGCPVGVVFSAVFPDFFVSHGAKRLGIILNCLGTLDTFVKADTVFLDKTGTLTEGKLQIDTVCAAPKQRENELLQALVTAEAHVEDGFSKAVLEYAAAKKIVPQPITSLEIFPGQGVYAKTKKSEILAGSWAWLTEKGIKLPAGQSLTQAVIFVAQGNRYQGYVTLEDHLRPGAPLAISQLQQQGKEVILLSGDTETSVQAAARQVGVEKFNFNVLPKTKAEIITNLRALGKTVVMLGDGFNDIIALLKADGSLIFETGNNVYNHWVDIVVQREDLCVLADLFKINKRLQYTVWGNMALSVCVQGILLAVLLVGNIEWLGTWQAVLIGALALILLVLFNSMRLLNIK